MLHETNILICYAARHKTRPACCISHLLKPESIAFCFCLYLCIMADGSLFECAPLCFLVNKYGRFSHNVLKSTFSDFYSGDLIVDAKNRLLEDLSNLNLTVPLPRIPKRRDSASRLNSEVDDIFNLLAFADEQKLFSKLPRYSVVDIDTIPSIRLFEGDMKVLMYRIDRSERKLAELLTSMSAMSSCLAGLQRTCRDLVNVQQTTSQANSGGPTVISTNINSALTSLTSLSAPLPSVQSEFQCTDMCNL